MTSGPKERRNLEEGNVSNEEIKELLSLIESPLSIVGVKPARWVKDEGRKVMLAPLLMLSSEEMSKEENHSMARYALRLVRSRIEELRERLKCGGYLREKGQRMTRRIISLKRFAADLEDILGEGSAEPMPGPDEGREREKNDERRWLDYTRNIS